MADKAKRAKAADHAYINAAGEKVDQEKATGISYTDLATKKVVVYQIPEIVAGSVAGMLALFGARTLATNTASARRNGDGSEYADDAEAVTSRLAAIKPDDWGSEGGGGGRGYNLETLAQAIVNVAKAAGKKANAAKVLAALTDGKTLADGTVLDGPAYRARMVKAKGVKAEYVTLMAGESAEDIDDDLL